MHEDRSRGIKARFYNKSLILLQQRKGRKKHDRLSGEKCRNKAHVLSNNKQENENKASSGSLLMRVRSLFRIFSNA